MASKKTKKETPEKASTVNKVEPTVNELAVKIVTEWAGRIDDLISMQNEYISRTEGQNTDDDPTVRKRDLTDLDILRKSFVSQAKIVGVVRGKNYFVDMLIDGAYNFYRLDFSDIGDQWNVRRLHVFRSIFVLPSMTEVRKPLDKSEANKAKKVPIPPNEGSLLDSFIIESEDQRILNKINIALNAPVTDVDRQSVDQYLKQPVVFGKSEADTGSYEDDLSNKEGWSKTPIKGFKSFVALSRKYTYSKPYGSKARYPNWDGSVPELIKLEQEDKFRGNVQKAFNNLPLCGAPKPPEDQREINDANKTATETKTEAVYGTTMESMDKELSNSVSSITSGSDAVA